MELFVFLLMVPALMKVVWRYAIRTYGVPSMISSGVSMMLPLSVLNLDSTEMVSTVMVHDANYRHYHIIWYICGT